jgi:hypothetical protein
MGAAGGEDGLPSGLGVETGNPDVGNPELDRPQALLS